MVNVTWFWGFEHCLHERLLPSQSLYKTEGLPLKIGKIHPVPSSILNRRMAVIVSGQEGIPS